jgi:UDP-N-acetyl-2-amino-2-deoxyglucuronate dehydrogenase
MSRFGLIGAAGYIAPLHMKAIRDTGNQLVAAFDPRDSVGVMDKYFPEADFFTEFERFDRHIHKISRSNQETAVDFISICSPNYLHDSHVRFALRSNVDAVCEKPVVLNAWNIDALQSIEKDTGRKVFTVLQLRLHPAIKRLKKMVQDQGAHKKFDIDLTYISARGKWYFSSWKGDEQKSGGVATNIGIHFFDMLNYVFGGVLLNTLHYRNESKAAGYIEYEKARVRWFLSTDVQDIPPELIIKSIRTFRSIKIDGEDIDFSEGFNDLHTRIYEDILSGGGFGLEDNRVAIETVTSIRTQAPKGITGDFHPFLKKYAG